ncbi:hypothetical protein B5F40_08315 [Gordonibacter sp. An230]|nr:hypothetical protein B5F40_08315 [Gordonibacter sp. An230]
MRFAVPANGRDGGESRTSAQARRPKWQKITDFGSPPCRFAPLQGSRIFAIRRFAASFGRGFPKSVIFRHSEAPFR